MKGLIGKVVTALMMLSVYFFYVSGKHKPVVLQDLTDKPVVSEAAYSKGKPLSAPQVSESQQVVGFPIKGTAPKKNVIPSIAELIADPLYDKGVDGMGGYYEEYALGPEDEVSQFWEQGPMGEINLNAIAPGVGEVSMLPDDIFLMGAEPSESGTKVD
jgi:hypothetical protein